MKSSVPRTEEQKALYTLVFCVFSLSNFLCPPWAIILSNAEGNLYLKKKNGAMHWTPRARGSSHHAEGIDALVSREPASGSTGFPSTFPGPCHHTKSNILTPKKPVTSTQARSKPEGDLSGFDKLLATSRRKSKLPRLAKTAWNKRNTKGGEFARPDVKAYYKVILINIMWY